MKLSHLLSRQTKKSKKVTANQTNSLNKKFLLTILLSLQYNLSKEHVDLEVFFDLKGLSLI